MSEYYTIHPQNPQERLLQQAIDIVKSGGVIAVPTDCCYVICCQIGDKTAEGKIANIREHKDDHRLALLMADLSMASNYAQIDNKAYKIMRGATPGAYTFILPAKKDLPKRLHLKRKTIGIRIPDNKILLNLLELYELPLYSSTLWLPHDDFPLFEPEVIQERLSKTLDLIIDGGSASATMTSIISLENNSQPEVLREGAGDISIF